MSTEIRRRRGTSAQHAGFTGALAEVTVDITRNTLVVHDGATAGGFPLSPWDGKFKSIAEVGAVAIRTDTDFIETSGYSQAGDGGGAEYRRVDEEPEHDGKIQSGDGAWWEISSPVLDIRMFGAHTSVVDNKPYIQSAIDTSVALRRKLVARGGDMFMSGPLVTASNLHLEWEGDCWFKPNSHSGAVGAFLTNVHPTSNAARQQTNVRLVNPQIDLDAFVYGPEDTAVGENCIGLARGARNFSIEGGTIKNCRANWYIAFGGPGGKAIGLDGGVYDIVIKGTRVENCYYGFWFRGLEATFGADGLQQLARVKVLGTHVENCSLAYAFQGRDADEDIPDANPEDFSVYLEGITYHNCGFAPFVPAAPGRRYKGAPIMLGEAQNVIINGCQGYNDADYIDQNGGWPETGDVAGQGLSGPIGAVIYGWGRNVMLSNIQHNGDVDSLVWVGRASLSGDDGAPSRQPFSSKFDINGLQHFGSASWVMSQDDLDPVTASSQVRGDWTNIHPDVITDTFVNPNANMLVDMTLQVYDDVNAKRIRGTPKFIANAVGGTALTAPGQQAAERVDSLQATFFTGRYVLIPDDTAIAYDPGVDFGYLFFTSGVSLLRAFFSFRLIGSAQMALPVATSFFQATTGVLSGTTGADEVITVSAHTDGKIYIENRRGATITAVLSVIGGH